MIVRGYEIEPGANLVRAYLEFEDLAGVDLTNANLYRSELEGTDLSGAILAKADLEGADLHDANLRGADLRGADLRKADLSGADLTGADLTGALLRNALLHGADLTNAQISEAKLSGARFWCADLTGVLLPEGLLETGSLSGAIIPGAPPSYSNLATDKTLKDLRGEVAYWREIYNNTDCDDDYETYVDNAEKLIHRLYRYVERALAIVNPRGAHRERVIASLKCLAHSVLDYTDDSSDNSAVSQRDEIIYSLDGVYNRIVSVPDRQSGVAAFLSEIGLKLDVEVEETPENGDSIAARLDQLASDVANLAGISKQETPAKTILAAIEASNLTPEIMELVSDAVLDCADME
jgi:hypothetical protein